MKSLATRYLFGAVLALVLLTSVSGAIAKTRYEVKRDDTCESGFMLWKITTDDNNGNLIIAEFSCLNIRIDI